MMLLEIVMAIEDRSTFFLVDEPDFIRSQYILFIQKLGIVSREYQLSVGVFSMGKETDNPLDHGRAQTEVNLVHHHRFSSQLEIFIGEVEILHPNLQSGYQSARELHHLCILTKYLNECRQQGVYSDNLQIPIEPPIGCGGTRVLQYRELTVQRKQ